MSVSVDELLRIATDVWRDTLTQQLVPAATAGVAEMTASVQITGAFRGAVVLLVPRSLAVSAAVVMLARERAAVGAGEARDALGELANMLGGHVKGLVTGPSELLLPIIVEDGVHGLTRSRYQILAECSMSGSDGVFTVQVLVDVG